MSIPQPAIGEIDFELLRLFLAQHWRQACQDPLGYAFWGLIWGCAFAATYLLLRMFFTGWGDKNVTEKTLALSVLVHAAIAMLSTTVMLARDPAAAPTRETRTRVRRVLVAGEQTVTPAEQTGGGGRPRWEAPIVAGNESGRRTVLPAQVDVPLPSRTSSERPSARELPESAAPLLSAEVPEPSRAEPAAGGPSRSRAIDTPVDLESTAVARSEASVGGRRQERRSESTDGAAERPERARSPRKASSVASSAPEPAPAADIDVEPIRTRPIPTDDTPRPRRVPSNTPSVEEADPTAVAATPEKSARGSPFQRSGRISPRSDDAGAPIANRTARPSVPAGSGTRGSATEAEVALRAPGDGTGEVVPGFNSPTSPGTGRSNRSKIPETYRLRDPKGRSEAARRYGATPASEQAVAASLKWLAKMQNADGSWPMLETTEGEDPEPARFTSDGNAVEEARTLAERRESGFNAESGVTALAILAFLGAGHTSEDPVYGTTVARGLDYLAGRQYRWKKSDPAHLLRNDGYLGGQANRFARMYCHGMATIALGEAYGMTRDPALREPLTRALQYIVRMQYPDGSWRYSDPRGQDQPTGDMSLFGWQVMALKSGQTANVRLPEEGLEKALGKARQFLQDRRSEMRKRFNSPHGGLAAYRSGERPKPSMTAEALFSWQLLGVNPREPAVVEAVEFLRGNAPRLANQDLYYWYYATLAMFQQGGDPWEDWNAALLEAIVQDQRTQGELAGSWDPRRPWGDYGGRVFSTAMSTLCLEVYYRYLPLYQVPAERAVRKR